MAPFRLTRSVAAGPEEVWRRVTDWRAHAARVPLTRLASVRGEPVGPGTLVVVRSGIGRFGVDDPMEVVRWEPPAPGVPGRCRLEKRGRVVRGWAEITVLGRERETLVVWEEELAVWPLPRGLDPLVARVGRRMFGRALDGVLRGVAPGGGGAF
ncbi:SRPBCC family protein [Streptomyces sp. NPDC057638]|uniref:SRPBCC family protein n=1 Tax=Streptomyces sp. NPDC057638 TaxID=3346190 RepID=UPI0036A96B8A